MTTPDKEWIEKATRVLTRMIGFVRIDDEAKVQVLAGELQSAFNQGVAQERERVRRDLADRHIALTPPPSEGER